MDAQVLSRFSTALADRFVIDRELGRGGMGVVYQARDVRLGRQIALKVMLPEVVDRIGKKSFDREIRYMARLQHPHILPLLEGGEVEELVYYAMPFVKGGSLRDVLKSRGTLSIDNTLKITEQVGSALEEAHSMRIVHCDLKPENILISGGMAVLSDFGIARSILNENVEWRKKDLGSAGSPVYVSPEQVTGETVDERSDVYSLACVVFEMLAGKPPFDGPTVEAIVARRFKDSAPFLSTIRGDVPARMSMVLSRALELDSRDRYPSVARFVNALSDSARTAAARGEAGARPGIFSSIASMFRSRKMHLGGQLVL